MHGRVRYFLIRVRVVNQRGAVGFERVRVRFKPYEEKVKEVLIPHEREVFFLQKWQFL